MAYEYDADTAVEPLGGNRFHAMVTPRYSIGPYPNGGYVLGIVVAALGEVARLPDPLAVSAHFVSPTEHDRSAEVIVEPVREGRSHATVAARLVQDGAERVRVLATYGDLGRATGPSIEHGSPPELPPREQCIRGSTGPLPNGLDPVIRHRFETWFHPGTMAWVRGPRSGRGEVGGWIRFADGREPDAASMVLFCDGMPPAVFDLVPGGWVPTLEFTVHVRARPAPGWLRVWFSTRHLRDGYLEEDGEVWDSAGVLVAQSRQLARVNTPPRPEAPSGATD
jgi:acyl-CoA thioesterase